MIGLSSCAGQANSVIDPGGGWSGVSFDTLFQSIQDTDAQCCQDKKRPARGL